MVDFMATYKCENIMEGGKPCGTTLKKFPARKMIPTYIYEVAIETKNQGGVEYKEYFLESFQELEPGHHTGMIFGRTETKSNSFYFTCLCAKKEKSKIEFGLKRTNRHALFDLVDAEFEYIKQVGFVLDPNQARLIFMIETIKRMVLHFNRELNLDHSLYFGAPGIGKSVALTILHHMFYSNSGFITGPRFSLPGLTGGQREVFYQDVSKKKNVPGLFSSQAFIFDEINNETFMEDDKAINLFKSVALAPSGTATTIGGKEFPRIAVIAASANYIPDKLRHYENKVKKIYMMEKAKKEQKHITDQNTLLMDTTVDDIPADFDFFCHLKLYGIEIPQKLKLAIVKVREDNVNYLTDFPKPLMERFYWSVLIHPKYDKMFIKPKRIQVEEHLRSKDLLYTKRELYTQLYISEFDKLLDRLASEALKDFDMDSWIKETEKFLESMVNKYPEFFSMFHRIDQVHVFVLYALSIINNEKNLSFETKRIFEKLISLLHNPIDIKDFHNPNFEGYLYIGESRAEILQLITEHPNEDLRSFVDLTRAPVRKSITELLNESKIKEIDIYKYEINLEVKYDNNNKNIGQS